MRVHVQQAHVFIIYIPALTSSSEIFVTFGSYKWQSAHDGRLQCGNLKQCINFDTCSDTEKVVSHYMHCIHYRGSVRHSVQYPLQYSTVYIDKGHDLCIYDRGISVLKCFHNLIVRLPNLIVRLFARKTTTHIYIYYLGQLEALLQPEIACTWLPTRHTHTHTHTCMANYGEIPHIGHIPCQVYYTLLATCLYIDLPP